MIRKLLRLPMLAGAALLVAALGAVAVAVPWVFDTGAASPTGILACSVKPSCDAGETAVFRMSSTANAHAGTPGGSTYGNVVCCSGVAGLGTQCTGTYDTVLTLSGPDNAHVASDGSYATEVCLSSGDNATVDCTYGATCDADYACLATISGSTNAHVADCDGINDYATKVCCRATALALCGDVDCDDDVDAVDALFILQYVVGLRLPSDQCPPPEGHLYLPAADVDCDDDVDAVDALFVLQHVVGLRPELCVCPGS